MKTLLFLAGFVVLSLCSEAQDVHFSQFYDMPLWRNPSLAGIFTGNVRAQALYRNQWQTVKVPYNTAALGIEYKAKGYCIDDDIAIIIGLQLLRDQAGISRFTRTEILGTATIRKKITQNTHVSVGVIAGGAMNSFSNSRLSWSDQYINDEYLPTNPTAQPFASMKRNYFDIGTGVSLNSGTINNVQWYAGIAAYHLSRPPLGFSTNDPNRLPVRYTINGGWGINFNDYSSNRIVFSGDYIWQGKQRELLIGAYCTFYKPQDSYDADDEGFDISVGAFYRHQDAVIPTIKLNFSRWSVGLSYDANISSLALASHTIGAMECSLKYRGAFNSEKGNCQVKGCHFD